MTDNAGNPRIHDVGGTVTNAAGMAEFAIAEPTQIVGRGQGAAVADIFVTHGAF